MRSVMRWLLITLGVTLAPQLQAHPAHAEEVQHPFVAGFERFYSDADPDDYLAQGGELLINELNCAACHQTDRFQQVPGPKLDGVGSRISDGAALVVLTRIPRFLKMGTTMPSMFAASDRDEDELEALLHYLASLTDESDQQLLRGIAERGNKLYHEVGCVACHGPDLEVRPAGMPADLVLEKPALPSSPIRLAVNWNADYLTKFLINPAERHPGGRMPNLALTEQEAADIAAYLQQTPATTMPVLEMALPDPDSKLVATGRGVFEAKGCNACHDAGDGYQPRPAPLMDELAANVDGGCLSETPIVGAIPHYFLSPLQLKAIKLALTNPPTSLSPIESEMMRRDCYACHTIHGRGGPETGREPFFGAFDPYAVDKDDFLPPAIDDFNMPRQQLLDILTGKAKRRYPNTRARMMVLPDAEANALIEVMR